MIGKALSVRQLILSIFCGLLFTGCFDTKKRGNLTEIKLIISDEPPKLDPRKATDHTSGAILQMCHEGLMYMNEKGASEPGLAEKHNISEDGKTYTFTIRPDAKWSNGDPLTARDFEYAWTKVLDPDFIGGDYHEQLFCIKNAKAFHDRKVSSEELGLSVKSSRVLEVELEQPTQYFLDLVSFYTFYPVHRHIAQKNERWAEDAGQDYVCSGPFRLAKWKHQNEIVLEKNSHYWRADDVKIKKINFLIVKDANTCLSMFEKGEIDLVGSSPYGELPPEAMESVGRNHAMQSVDVTSTFWCAVNTQHPLLGNKNIRKALALAINRRSIAENVVPGMFVATTHVLPAQLRVHQGPLFEDGNVSSARAHFARGLEELGATPEQFNQLKLLFDIKSSHQKIMQAVQQQWRDVLGIEVVLEAQERKVFLHRTHSRDFDLARGQWGADYFDAANFLEIFRYSQLGNNNHTGWENGRYVELLERARLEQNREKRQKIMEQAECVIVDELPVIPIFHQTNSLLVNQRLKNVKQTVLGPLEMRTAYLVN